MTLKRVWRPSPSYSPGAVGNSPRLLVVHTTEGATTNDNIANFLQGHNGVSYHASVDNYMDNTAYEYVYETDGAWAQCGFNSVAVCCVFCTPAGASSGWSADYWWNQQSRMMHNMAKWLAEESAQHGISLTALTSSQAQGSGRGVCEHQHLGSAGCGHSDCGNLPLDKLIALARDYAAGVPQPGPEPGPDTEENDVALMNAGINQGTPVPIIPGNTRIRLFTQGTAKVEITFRPSSKNFPVARLDLTADNAADASVPGGATAAWLVRRDDGTSDIAYAVGR